MKLIAGLDIGNGYTKGWASSAESNFQSSIDFQSGVAYLTSTHDMKTPAEEIPGVIDDIYNNMDASFDSPLIKDKERKLFGERGMKSGNSIIEFDVYSSISKAKQELSFMLTLGAMAGTALKNYYYDNKKLPTEVLKCEVEVAALALPIAEFKKYRKDYAEGYMASSHIVTIHNFDQIVNVEIIFKDVRIVAEGASAQIAIVNKGATFVEGMLADTRKLGEPLDGITAGDIIAATNTIGIDIGEGTVNLPVYQNGKFNPDVSITFDKGYGAVLNEALGRLQEDGMAFNSRKQLQAYLNTTPSPMQRQRYAKVQATVNEEIQSFAMEVSMQFSKIMQRVGMFNDVVFVYGGGANPVKPELHPMLIEKSKGFGEGACPILYLDSMYSRHLNRDGLYEIALKVANGATKKK